MPEPTKHTAEKLFIRHKEHQGFVDAHPVIHHKGTAVILRTSRNEEGPGERSHDDRCHAYLPKESAVALAHDILKAAGAEAADANLSDLRRHLDEALERVVLAEVKDHQAYAKGYEQARNEILPGTQHQREIIEALKGDLAQQEFQNARLQDTIRSGSLANADLHARVEDQHAIIRECGRTQDALREQVSDIKGRLDAAQEALDVLSNDYEALEDKHDDALGRLRAVRKILDAPVGADVVVHL